MWKGRTGLALIFFAPMAAVAVCLVLLFPRRMNAAADEWADQRARAVVNVLANAAAPALEFDDAENAREVLAAVAGDPAVLRAALRSGDGALLAWLPASDRAAAEALPPLDAVTGRIARRGRELVASMPVVARGGAHGNLVVAFSLESLTRQRRENWMVVLLMGGVTLIAGAAFGIVTSSFLLRRRRAEAALGRSERNLRGLIEVSPDAMIVHRAGSIVFANPAASQLFGGGDHLDELIPGAPPPRAPPAELTVAGPKGPIIADVRTLPLMFDGAPAALTTARDLTERHRMQAQLLLADRMASVGTLAAGVAHEINNPLSFVLANVDFVLEVVGVSADIPERDELVAALRDARKGGERVRDIVRELKTFSRADDESTEPVNVQHALDVALQMTATAIRNRAQLVKHYDEVPLVTANESRLGQVFVNLILNATQALTEGRDNVIEVTTHTDAAGRAVVEIRDTGQGIPPEIMGRIFDPFFTTKPVGVGTGLGLSICHSIVTGFGGDITVETRLGEGTTFSLTLPPAAPTRLSGVRPSPSIPLPRGARVLVVDDEPLVGQAVARTIGDEAEVECLSSARAALARLAAGARYDVILCDLMMPDMTGFELHAQLQSHAPEHVDRLVLMTGAVTPHAREFLASCGRPSIEKPFGSTELRRVMRRVAEQSP